MKHNIRIIGIWDYNHGKDICNYTVRTQDDYKYHKLLHKTISRFCSKHVNDDPDIFVWE